MKAEIEVRFLNIDHDQTRTALKNLGAKLEKPMQLMRRAIVDHPDRRNQHGNEKHWSWIRVRDEGDRVMLTYKQVAKSPDQATHEIEVEVSSYDETVAIFEAIGLKVHSMQETKRETWMLHDCEVVLDEWPWLPLMLEIEGPNEASLQAIAKKLNLKWHEALRGNAVDAYRQTYPDLIKTGKEISNTPKLSFDTRPDWLKVK